MYLPILHLSRGELRCKLIAIKIAPCNIGLTSVLYKTNSFTAIILHTKKLKTLPIPKVPIKMPTTWASLALSIR